MKLVSYFSASGITKEVAIKINSIVNGDLFEIEPVVSYTNEDLDWTNSNSRSSVEMRDSIKPSIKNKVSNIDNYDTIFIGFPVWWYTAPTIINEFIEENNLENKKIYVFATSGSSSVSKSFEDLKRTYPNLNFISAKRFDKDVKNEEIVNWLNR